MVFRGVDASSRRAPITSALFLGGTMLEHDQQRVESPAQVQVRDETASSRPNQYGYDPSLWPPHT
jgi:hypothetical protein